MSLTVIALFGNWEVETELGQNILNVVTMRIKMQGFIVFDFAKEYPEGRKDLARWLEEGKIKRKETIVKGGLKVAEEALVGLYKGINTGKSVTLHTLALPLPPQLAFALTRDALW
jgi:NADPH-dependent curcumin reductase CurA